MKKLVSSFAGSWLVLLFTVSYAAQTPVTETVYDSEKDLTTVRVPTVRISNDKDRYHSLDVTASFNYPGKSRKKPESINLEVISVVKARRLNSDLYVVFVADGEEMHFGSSRSAIMNPVKGRLWIGERMVFSVPIKEFERLASAKEVAVKLGGVVFPFPDDAQEALHQLLKLALQ